MKLPNFEELKEYLKDLFIDIRYFIPDNYSMLKERIGRSLAFAKFGYMHYDFESAYLYSLMSFKLKRIKNSLENGCAVQEAENMAALDELITICDRLFNESHEDKYWDAHNTKWGEPEFDCSGPFKINRANVNTPEEKEQELKDHMEIYPKAQADRDADIDRMAVILKKHQQTWWE